MGSEENLDGVKGEVYAVSDSTRVVLDEIQRHECRALRAVTIGDRG